jgi:hypothetical protein
VVVLAEAIVVVVVKVVGKKGGERRAKVNLSFKRISSVVVEGPLSLWKDAEPARLSKFLRWWVVWEEGSKRY